VAATTDTTYNSGTTAPALEVVEADPEAWMRKKDLERYQKRLQAKRSDVLARVRAARDTEQESNDEEAPDLGDRALSTMSRDLMYELTGTERDLLRRIDAALDRIGAGTYGLCQNCGEKVHDARLEALPWARHCIDCQELQDRGEL
jgi:DnaK suppressor protein